MKVKSFDGICKSCLHSLAGDCKADELFILRDELTRVVCVCDNYIKQEVNTIERHN